jgi:beta-galactosidase
VLASLNYDLMRSLAGGRPWLLLEHAPSAVNWREVNVPKRPGLMRLWVHQAIARGSDGAMFFQWRASRAGSEKFHSALVPHLGREARGWAETLRLGRELRTLAEVAGSTSEATVALLLDWESWWALEGADHPSARLDLPALLLAHYRHFHAANIAVDFAHPGDDLGRYALAVAPNLYLARDATVESLTGFVRDGGVLVCGGFSGVVDEHDHIRTGGLRALTGAVVDEVWPIPPGEEVEVAFASGERARARDWSEWLVLEGAEPIASYASSVLDGQPAVVRNRLADGLVYYSSAGLDEPGLVLDAAIRDAGVEPVGRAPAGVELTRRGSYLFVLNHSDEPVEIRDLEGVELLTGEAVHGALRLGPLGVAVVRG